MREQHQQRTGGGGVPDGLLLGLLGFLLSLLLLVWTATGLAGLLGRGSWPTGVTFKNTPQAVRSLAASPQDLPAAWPTTPPAELSGYGLFWGIAISELMVLIVLTIFVLGTLARWKAVRAARRDRMRAYGKGPTDPHTDRTHRNQPYEHDTPALEDTAHRPDAQGPMPPPPTPSFPQPELRSAHHPAQPAPTVPAAPDTSVPHAFAAQGPRPPRTEGTPPAAVAGPPTGQGYTPVPSPRVPRVLFGDPATRRPATVQAVRDAEGAALVVTSDPTVWAETKDARAKLGPVLVYDPGHLCDTPARLHWSPTAGCDNAATAAARATALLAPVRPRSVLDTAMADTADTLLRCWLHAAAVDGRPFKQVHRWAQGGGAQEAVRILRTHPQATAGLAGLLESALTAHPERREIAQQLVARALSSLSSIHIREACTPNRTDSLTLESFLNEGGTLYLVGEPIEDPKAHPGAMPLLTALASDVVEHGRRMAARSSDGRLDPPMTLILDDVAAVAPLPLLPDLLTAGQDQGLPTLVLLRSAEQARARWPQSDLPV
ncbi:type VI secretion protein [Streptomyces sp. NPDC004609]|uniref:type VI secretion protein n=1 Tax=Streptomyces sp. NPDC004609 TaxID=3364704 RepID=UPI00368CAB65